jgi:hypothetical protein
MPHLPLMFQVLILGLLPVDYGLFFAAVGVVATFIGQTAVDFLVHVFPSPPFMFNICSCRV